MPLTKIFDSVNFEPVLPAIETFLKSPLPFLQSRAMPKQRHAEETQESVQESILLSSSEISTVMLDTR